MGTIYDFLFHYAVSSFFEKTPLGRILNRFSRDMDVVDMWIRLVICCLIIAAIDTFGALTNIAIQASIFITVMLPLGTIFSFFPRLYMPATRQLKRIDTTTRSPIYSYIGESVSAFELSSSKDSIRPGDIGLMLVAPQRDTESSIMCLDFIAELEVNIVCVESIAEYSALLPEGERFKGKCYPGSNNWPTQGAIHFDNYSTHCRPELDKVLSDIDCRIGSGEKIGIVGRTGAGKSTISLALFRILKAFEGGILIDDCNIDDLGLHTLRNRLAIIPQDPVIFCGSLRFNLDPFDKYSDDEIWACLELSHLKKYFEQSGAGLDFQATEGGKNLSLGQRQLICLTRALLKKSKILVLDEATAAIDMETDALVQETIRSQFSDCTILTIAHRLNTIMDSDRIMVLDAGKIVEFDSPINLMRNKVSYFHSLAKEAGLLPKS